MVDSRNNSNLIYLPLDKLISQTGQAPVVAGDGAAARSAASNATAAPTPAPDPVPLEEQVQRSRDSRDPREARDREGR
jgi:membrane protease subunit HflK